MLFVGKGAITRRAGRNRGRLGWNYDFYLKRWADISIHVITEFRP